VAWTGDVFHDSRPRLDVVLPSVTDFLFSLPMALYMVRYTDNFVLMPNQTTIDPTVILGPTVATYPLRIAIWKREM
jgi:hypothetical protein